MLQSLLQLDRQLFQLINQKGSNTLFDVLMPLLRNQYTWVPVYVFLLVLVLFNFKRKEAGWWILFFLATFALTDIISSQLIKAWVQRPRPCMDIYAAESVRMLIPCSHSYSFVSSHAANHFGIAAFIYQTFKQTAGRWAALAFILAAAVCYAQVYVGAHFPFDIMGGAFAGTLIGLLTSHHYHKQFTGLQKA